MGLIDRVSPPWSAPQRGVILVLLSALLIYGSIQFWRNRAYVADPQPITAPHAADLADKLDPNTADAATLAVLPLIGEKRASDIIAYRDRYAQITRINPRSRKLKTCKISAESDRQRWNRFGRI